MKAEKVDKNDRNIKLEGVHFALYRGVNSVDGLIPDTTPVEGYEDLVTTSEGVIPTVTADHLTDGTYFLRETEQKDGYKLLARPIRFTIHAHDVVLYDDTSGGSIITDVIVDDKGNEVTTMSSTSGVRLIKTDGNSLDFVLQIPNEKDTQNYYFDIEKIIFADNNIHGNPNDKEQKFLFKVERFKEGTDNFNVAPETVFYVSLNCDQEMTYTENTIMLGSQKYPYTSIYHVDDAATYPKSQFLFSETAGVKIKKTYNTGTNSEPVEEVYTYPASIWNGRKTVHVNQKGIYRVTEVKEWSTTDYDFWNGSNVYKGYGDTDKTAHHIKDGGSDGAVIFNVSDVKADRFKTAEAVVDGKPEMRPTASFTNSETEYAYFSSQAYAENTIKLP